MNTSSHRYLSALSATRPLVDLGRSDLLVIDPMGKLAGSRSFGGELAATAMFGVNGVAVDRSGRLIYETEARLSRTTPAGMEMITPDSAPIMALDFKTGAIVPVAQVRVAGSSVTMAGDPMNMAAMKTRMKRDPFPTLDDWVMMPDGTLAIFRGVDLHIDWIAPDGAKRSTPAIPYIRKPVTEADKQKYLTRLHASANMIPAMMPGMTTTQEEPDSFPQFMPPFTVRAAMAASDGTIWLPSKILSPDAPEGYDVIGPMGRSSSEFIWPRASSCSASVKAWSTWR